MKKLYFSFLFFLFVILSSLLGGIEASAQSLKNFGTVTPNAVTLDSTNLPIVGVYTYWKQPQDTVDIKAFMGIIDNGYNKTNHVTDTVFTYYGYITMSLHGTSSPSFLCPQKSYNVTTCDSALVSIDSAILGMKKEHDWLLRTTYFDHSLMHDVLVHHLARQMGHWSPHMRYCEMELNTFINWNYNGVYLMSEKIKRGKNRVNISKMDSLDNAGDSLTGGFIFAVDSNPFSQNSGWNSTNPLNNGLFYKLKYPSGSNITPQQLNYISSYMTNFENVMASPNFANPTTGYRKYIDVTSFIDFFLIQELCKNLDAYKRSAYMYKDRDSKGGKLTAGPQWDFDNSWGVQFGGCPQFASEPGWTYPFTCWINSAFPVPFWWGRLLQDPNYTHDLKCRWLQLRASGLDTANMFHYIDIVSNYISAASARQYQQWNINTTLPAEVAYLKSWIAKRLAWMDAHMPGNCLDLAVNENNFENSFSIYPNPFSKQFTISTSGLQLPVQLEIYNTLGEKIFFKTLNRKQETVSLNAAKGIFFLRVSDGKKIIGKKKIIVSD